MSLTSIALFIHVIGVATWFGSITLMAMYLRNATRTKNLENMATALATTHRWNLTMMIPTSVLVLITGIYMFAAIGGAEKPLWLLVKERFGSLFVILFIIVISFYGKKLLQKVKDTETKQEMAQTLLKRYILILNLSVLCMVILIFFVTVKIT